MPKPKPLYRGYCDYCGDEYDTVNPDQKYCDKHVPQHCHNCNSRFIPSRGQVPLCDECHREYIREREEEADRREKLTGETSWF